MNGLSWSRGGRVCALLAGVAGVLGGDHHGAAGGPSRATRNELQGFAAEPGGCGETWRDRDGDAANGRETTLGARGNRAACGDACSSVHGAAACLRGACSISCYAGWGDCDGDAANGCETALRSPGNCGACGATCELPHADETCATGTCLVSRCETGWCDANRKASDGCEYDLNGNPDCSERTDLGKVRGDEGNDTVTHAGFGERRYRVYVAEASSSNACHDLGVRIRLTPAFGTDYDLYAYCSSCDSAVAHSTNRGSAMEEVTLRWDEDCLWGVPTGTDSGRGITIWVVYRNARTCGEYTLTVSGDVISGANTCAPK